MKKITILIFAVSYFLMGCTTSNPKIAKIESKITRKTASETYLTRCYVQNYSDTYLQKNPNQLVKKIVVGIYENAIAADFIRLKFVTTKPLKTKNSRQSFSQVIAESSDCDLVSPPFQATYSLGCRFGADKAYGNRADFDLKETVVDSRNGNFLQISSPVEVSRINKSQVDYTLKADGGPVATLNLANDPTKGKYALAPLNLKICETEF